MALDTVSNGTYFEFDPLANDESLVMFRVLQHEPPREITPKGGGKTNTVNPVLVDFVVLDGPLAKTVVRRESVIGAGITYGLSRKEVGTDVVVRMGFVPNKHGGRPFVAANAVERDSADWNIAVEVMKKTNGDPYTAAERSANPTASLASTAPEPAPEFVAAQSAPAAPAVGGPAGPQWGEAPAAASNGQPVSAAAW